MMDDIDRSTDWWAEALKGNRGELFVDQPPKAGFYRTKWKDKRSGTVRLQAIAYWFDSTDGKMRCQRDGRDVAELDALDLWPFACMHPISEDLFWHFRDTGVWKDIDEAVQKPATEVDNVSLAKEIATVKSAAAKYTKIESDEEMNLAQSVRAKLQELGSKADKLRAEEKEPHLEASRAVDAKWQPMIKEAKASADGLRKAMQDWNDLKLEAAAKAQAENQKPNVPPPSTQISGGMGRAAHVGVKNVVTAIDIDLAFRQFREEPALHDMLMTLAQRAVDAGIPVPGTTIEKKSAIR